MKTVGHELIVVDWIDAGGDNTDGWQSIEDFEADSVRYKIRSVGFPLAITKTYLHLCSDVSNDSDEAQAYNTVNSIPRGCITKIMLKLLLLLVCTATLVGCTTITYEGPYGKVSYTSSKNITAEYVKDGEDMTLTLKGNNNAKMDVLKGVLGAMK